MKQPSAAEPIHCGCLRLVDFGFEESAEKVEYTTTNQTK